MAQSAVEQLGQCYELATTPNEKYACMGMAVQVCQAANSEADIATCVADEARFWMRIADQTYQAGLDRAEAIEILEVDNLQGSTPWTTGLTDYRDQLIALRDQQCAIESSPEESAGYPELALRSCQMRENARMAIRLFVAIENMK